MKRVVLCTHPSDSWAVQVLWRLKERGVTVNLLGENENAPFGQWVLFTVAGEPEWPNRLIRVAAHEYWPDNCPSWAKTTPLVIAMKKGDVGAITEAVLQALLRCEKWKPQTQTAPWMRNQQTLGETAQRQVETWHNKAAEAVTVSDASGEPTPPIPVPAKKKRVTRRGKRQRYLFT